MKKPSEILVATGNAGKVSEYETLLAGLPVRLRGLREFADVQEVEETGTTFEENACLKAVGYAQQTGRWTLADDSGLEVDALGGAPGVFSARFGGAGLSDAERAEKLLAELKKAENKSRNARFICVIVLASETGEIIYQTKGVCEGQIALSYCGVGGFGYDPIFIPSGFTQTFGELSSEIKHKISHRAQAVNEIMRFLLDFFTKSLDQA
jgi:XTP/dITP diphosphohydrolase